MVGHTCIRFSDHYVRNRVLMLLSGAREQFFGWGCKVLKIESYPAINLYDKVSATEL